MTVVAAVDSYSPPTNEQLAQAKGGAIRLWNGYLSSPQDPGIDPVWRASDFARIRAALGPVILNGVAYNGIAYCSGDAEPLVCKALGRAWNVLIALDVEGGIRPLGPWTQPWIDAAGCGVYGNAPVMVCRASFHVIAAWTSIPEGSWPSNVTRPPGPCGWQWAGNVPMLGSRVDRNLFDSSFVELPAPPPTPSEDDDMVWLATAGVRPTTEGQDPHGNGAVYLTNGLFKAWMSVPAALAEYEKVFGPVRDYSSTPFVLDHMIELPTINALYVAMTGGGFSARTTASHDPA